MLSEIKSGVKKLSRMVRTKPGQKVTREKLESTLSKLETLSEKPKSELSLRESIYFLREKLQSALKKGYSYQDLSEILEQQEIKVSAATLKQYLTEIEKEKRSRKRVAKSGETKQSSHPETSSASEGVTASADLSAKKASADLEQSSVEPENQDSLTDTEPSESVTKSAKRRPTKAAKPNTDVSSDFNKY